MDSSAVASHQGIHTFQPLLNFPYSMPAKLQFPSGAPRRPLSYTSWKRPPVDPNVQKALPGAGSPQPVRYKSFSVRIQKATQPIASTNEMPAIIVQRILRKRRFKMTAKATQRGAA